MKHKIQYYETDMMGVAHHSNYIRWMEEARIDFMDQLGFPYVRMEAEGIICPVKSLQAKYLKPAVFGDEVDIAVSVMGFNGVVVTLGYEMSVSGEQIITPKVVRSFAKIKILTLSPLVAISLAIAIIMMLIYKFTAFGRKMQATGCDRNAARMVGIKVDRVRYIVFVISGALAGIAGALQCVNLGILMPGSICEGSEFLAITACVLGGTSLAGGYGNIIPGTLIGVIFYYSIENGLGLLGANVYLYPVVRGIVIYLAMVTDSLKRAIGTQNT